MNRAAIVLGFGKFFVPPARPGHPAAVQTDYPFEAGAPAEGGADDPPSEARPTDGAPQGPGDTVPPASPEDVEQSAGEQEAPRSPKRPRDAEGTDHEHPLKYQGYPEEEALAAGRTTRRKLDNL